MNNITQEEIAKQITDLINKNVERLNHNDKKYNNLYELIMEDLENEIRCTEELIEDFTESKLTINKIEQEGYLRCLKTMVNRFRDLEK